MMTSSLQYLLLARAGRKTREAMARVHPEMKPSQEDIGDRVPDDLDDVAFASGAARSFAEKKGLTWSDFSRSNVPATGETGYRTSDVRAVLRSMEDVHADT